MISCTLCSSSLPHHPIIDQEKTFCCLGCHAVFNILLSKNQLENYQESPVFKQALRSGLISNPALLEQIRRERIVVPDNELQKLHLEVSDMWCPACAEVIRLVLLQEKGVVNCVVDYSTDLASVEFAPRYISKDKIYQLIASFGYQAQPLDSAKNAVSFSLYLRFIVAAFCSLNIMMFAYAIYATYFDRDDQSYGPLFSWLSFFTALPVIGYSAWPIFRRFVTSLKVGLFGMETLVIIGVASAFGLSVYELLQGGTRVYFDSLSVIITFVLLGKIIEARAKFSAKDSLLRLARALPKRGRKRFPDGSQNFVLIKEVTQGDTLVAFSGEKIVLDGVVIEGVGTCDESLMTGEAVPIEKITGASVLGGTILQTGSLAYRVTAKTEETVLHRIMDMVQQDIGHKTSYVRAADAIVRWFVPVIVMVAACTALVCLWFGITDAGSTSMQTAIIRAVSVLLISCPCAIGIAAPLAESQVMNVLASLGAIVRNRGCLSVLGSETAYVFDKTGTVTEGRFEVMQGLESLTSEECSVLKGMASQSIHPIACAIAQAIEEPPIRGLHVEEFAGHGLRTQHQGKCYLLGSAAFLSKQGLNWSSESTVASLMTTVHFACGQRIIPIMLGDRVRPDVKEVISKLAPAHTFLLSGDSTAAVQAVAKECGFDHWMAGQTPLMKREFIEELRRQGHVVCMIGDGINDATALTAAHVGISVVSATDISIQVSDLLLTTDRLQVIPKIRSVAKKGRAIIRQNLFWAFFYNVVGIGLAAFGWLSPIFAACAMVVSSLIVLFNAYRLVDNVD